MASDKVRKVQLQLDDDADCAIYGIVSPEPGYKLCLDLNNLLGISMKSDSPVLVADTRGDETLFQRFSDLSTLPWKWTSLVSNRSDSRRLARKLTNIDYLLLRFDDTDAQSDVGEFTAMVRNSEITNAIFPIDRSLIDREILENMIPHI